MDVTEGWQVAVTDFAFPDHFLLENEELYRTHKDISEHRVLQSKKPTKIFLRSWPTLHDTLLYIRQTFKQLLQLTWSKTQCTWKVNHSDYIIVLSKSLQHAVGLWQDVLTPWDKSATNCSIINYNQVLPANQYLIFVPMSHTHETYLLKDKATVFGCDTLIQLMDKYVNTTFHKKILRINQPMNSQLYVFSEGLHALLPFNQGGTCMNPLRRVWDEACNITLDKVYSLFIYSLTDMITYHDPFDLYGDKTTVKSIQRPGDVAGFLAMLNYLLNPENGIYVSLRYDNHVIIEMHDLTQKIVLGKELQDILGFDKNTFTAPNTYVSQKPLSSGFHQLYLCCSLADFSTVGRVEDQLLLTIPLNSTEKVQPIYVPLKCGKTKQIDFTLCNEKGELVRFPKRTSTYLKLHFRQ